MLHERIMDQKPIIFINFWLRIQITNKLVVIHIYVKNHWPYLKPPSTIRSKPVINAESSETTTRCLPRLWAWEPLLPVSRTAGKPLAPNPSHFTSQRRCQPIGRDAVHSYPVFRKLHARRTHQPQHRVLRHYVVRRIWLTVAANHARRANNASPHAPLQYRTRCVFHARRYSTYACWPRTVVGTCRVRILSVWRD